MYEDLLLKEIQKEELDGLVSKKIADFQGLLTREIALKLIAKEKGLLKEEEKSYKIKEIPKGARKINLVAKIVKILNVNTYNSGKRSRGMILQDDSGEIELKLWEDDISFFSKIKVGDEITIKNAYEKNGVLSLAYNGDIELLTAAPLSTIDKLEDGKTVNTRAFITKIIGGKGYIDKNNQQKIYFVFLISDGKQEVRCVIWNDAERGRLLQPGDEVIIQNALYRNNEIHLNASSRLLAKSSSAIRGAVKDVASEKDEKGDALRMTVGNRQLLMDRANALKVFGVNIADDLSLSTIVYIKKAFLLNGNIVIKGKEVDGKFSVE